MVSTPASASSPKVFHGSIFPVSVFTRETLSTFAAPRGVTYTDWPSGAQPMMPYFDSSPGIGWNPPPSSGQIPRFPSGPRTAMLLPSGEIAVPAMPLGSDRLGISGGQINHVVAHAVPGFNPRSQQP